MPGIKSGVDWTHYSVKVLIHNPRGYIQNIRHTKQ